MCTSAGTDTDCHNVYTEFYSYTYTAFINCKIQDIQTYNVQCMKKQASRK